jgi:hypothetical protein
MKVSKPIQVARGDEPTELLLKDVRVVNVFFDEMKIDLKNLI